MSQLSSSQLTSVAIMLADLLKGKQYALRGTSSLLLQNYDMRADDIDIVCDETTALAANIILKDYVVDLVKYSESAQFKSFYGKFIITGVQVEIMGDWQIKNSKGSWSDVFDGTSFVDIDLQGHKLHVTPVDLEMKMFLYMGRWNAYHKIKSQFETRSHKDSLDSLQPSLI